MECIAWFFGFMVGCSILAFWSVSWNKVYYVDHYFLREILQNNENFKYVTIKPYHSGGYYMKYNFGRVSYIAKDTNIKLLYGARVQELVEGVCWDLRIPKDSMYSEIKEPDEVVIKFKDDYVRKI